MSVIIISDTSCLIALDQIGMKDLLKDLFETIHITEEVLEEFGEGLPNWIKVRKVKDQSRIEQLKSRLDLGEASSIALALEIEEPCILIIDEKLGRKVAKEYDLEIIGTLKVLLLAKQSKLIDSLESAIEQLEGIGFRISKKIKEELIKLGEEK